MNELEIGVKTMDSREIAELLGARHAEVFESITTQLPKTGYTAIPYTYTHPQNGQKYQAYRLPYRETMIIASGYSVELRAKVIDRWMELEKANTAKLPDFTNPAESARAWAAEYEAKIESQKKLALAQPKVDFFDAVSQSHDTVDMGEVAKILNIPGLGRNNLFALLRGKKILMHDNAPYQRYLDLGYFKMVECSWNAPGGLTHVAMKPVVFQKGLDFIRKAIGE